MSLNIILLMKNFVNFERAYSALIDAKNAINGVSSRHLSEYGGNEVRARHRTCVNGIDVALTELRRWFKEHFPKTRVDAFHSDQFTFEGFFDMLKRYPELAKENESALRSLLSNMKGGNPVSMRIDKIPDISEFIK